MANRPSKNYVPQSRGRRISGGLMGGIKNQVASSYSPDTQYNEETGEIEYGKGPNWLQRWAGAEDLTGQLKAQVALEKFRGNLDNNYKVKFENLRLQHEQDLLKARTVEEAKVADYNFAIRQKELAQDYKYKQALSEQGFNQSQALAEQGGRISYGLQQGINPTQANVDVSDQAMQKYIGDLSSSKALATIASNRAGTEKANTDVAENQLNQAALQAKPDLYKQGLLDKWMAQGVANMATRINARTPKGLAGQFLWNPTETGSGTLSAIDSPMYKDPNTGVEYGGKAPILKPIVSPKDNSGLGGVLNNALTGDDYLQGTETLEQRMRRLQSQLGVGFNNPIMSSPGQFQ